MSEWISLESQIPEHGVGVLVTDGETVVVASIDNSTKFPGYKHWWDEVGFSGYEWDWDFNTNDITHWMPLPSPPVDTE